MTLILAIAITTIVSQYCDVEQTSALQEASAQSATGFLTYENPTYGVEIKYPDTWVVSTTGFQTYNNIVGFYSPLQNLTDILPAEVSLSIRTYLQNVTLDEYTNVTLGALK